MYCLFMDCVGNLNSTTLDKVRDLIEDGVYLVNPANINNDYLTPYFDFGDYLDEITWDTSVDLSSLELVDGTYSIPVTLTDQHNNEFIETVTVILEIESNEEQVIVNNTYTPINEEIIEYIQEITGLPEGETITVTLFGSTLPETFVAVAAPTEVEDSISYIELNLSSSDTGNFKINFSVSSSYDKNRIQVYVYESGNWVELPTTFIETTGGKHYFYFAVTHFSEFLIAEESVPTTPQDPDVHSSKCKTNWNCTGWSECVNGTQTRECVKEETGCKARNEKPDESKSCSLPSPRSEEKGEPGRITAEEGPGQAA